MKISKKQLENLIKEEVKKEILKENINQTRGIDKGMVLDEMAGLIVLLDHLKEKLFDARAVLATSEGDFRTDFENFSLFEAKRKIQALLKELEKITGDFKG